MVYGGARDNVIITKTKNKIIKAYKKNSLIPFLRELYVYLLAKKKKLKFIPKLLNYDLEKKTLIIENAGMSIYDLCKNRHCKKEIFLPNIKEIYQKLIDVGIYHNDIRYRNVLYNEKNDQFYLIDFEWTGPILKDKDFENLLKKMKKIKKDSKSNTKKKSKRSKIKTRRIRK